MYCILRPPWSFKSDKRCPLKMTVSPLQVMASLLKVMAGPLKVTASHLKVMASPLNMKTGGVSQSRKSVKFFGTCVRFVYD